MLAARRRLTDGHGDNGGMSPVLIRPAAADDVHAIVALIRELAEFEKLTHLLEVTPEKLAEHLFGPRPVIEGLVAETEGEQGAEVVAYALYFTNYSTFLAKPGLYLEDLYVRPAQRSLGIGRALLERLAAEANARGYGRFEWSVLDWNENAIRFYEKLGATVMPDWRICRLAGEALQRYAAN